MLEPKEVIVNGRSYCVNPLNPEDAHEFMHKLIVVRAFGVGMDTLGRKVLAQCHDRMGRSLGTAEHFQKCFSEFPEDMLELESKALEVLCAPWEATSGSESVLEQPPVEA